MITRQMCFRIDCVVYASVWCTKQKCVFQILCGLDRLNHELVNNTKEIDFRFVNSEVRQKCMLNKWVIYVSLSLVWFSTSNFWLQDMAGRNRVAYPKAFEIVTARRHERTRFWPPLHESDCSAPIAVALKKKLDDGESCTIYASPK